MIKLNSKITLEYLKKELDSFSLSPLEVDESIRHLRFVEETHFVKEAMSIKPELKEIESARYYSIVELEYVDKANTICHMRLMLPNSAISYFEEEKNNECQ